MVTPNQTEHLKRPVFLRPVFFLVCAKSLAGMLRSKIFGEPKKFLPTEGTTAPYIRERQVIRATEVPGELLTSPLID